MRRSFWLAIVLSAGVAIGLLVGEVIDRTVQAQAVVGSTSNANQVKLDAQTMLQLLRPLTAIATNTQQLQRTLRVLPAVTPPPTDPCFGPYKGNVAISQTATSKLVSGLSGLRVFVCSARVVAGAAEIVNFTEGTGTTCGTGETAVSGSTTAANGESYAANGGFSSGAGVTIMVTTKPGDDLCLKQSGSNRLAGNITYVQAP